MRQPLFLSLCFPTIGLIPPAQVLAAHGTEVPKSDLPPPHEHSPHHDHKHGHEHHVTHESAGHHAAVAERQ